MSRFEDLLGAADEVISGAEKAVGRERASSGRETVKLDIDMRSGR